MNKIVIRHSLFIVFCLLTLFCTACGGGTGVSQTATSVPLPLPVDGTPRAPYNQQILHIPIGYEITTLDPALSIDVYSNMAIRMIFGNLVQLDNDLQIQPQLAKSWSLSSDGLQWTFHLQPDLTFSDGKPLTSQDVAYSIDRALQPATQSTVGITWLSTLQDADLLHAGRIKTIIGDSLLTPDAETVIMKLSKKTAFFLDVLTYPFAAIVEKSFIERYGAHKFTDHLMEGGGAGPFKLSQHILNKEIDFVPNPYYYGLKPLLHKVVLITDSTRDSYQDYRSGQGDMTDYIPYDYLDSARKLKDEYNQTSLLSIDYIAMNFLAPPFDNLRIRQAFALALNREVLNQDLYGNTLIGTYHIIPQGVIGYNLNLTGPMGIKDSRGNIPLARQLFQQGLREEGWSDISKMPPIKLTYNQGADFFIKAIAQMWQDTLGVRIIPDPYDFTTLLTKLNNTMGNPQGLQMWLIGLSAYDPDPHYWTANFEKGSSNNWMNYGQNTTADALQEQTVQQILERADAEQDPTVRLQLYQSAEQQLVNQVAWVPLLQATKMILIKPYVKGLKLNPLDIIPAEAWANIYIAAH